MAGTAGRALSSSTHAEPARKRAHFGRKIEPAQDEVVRRIFSEFAASAGPKSIAAALNRESVPGPRGGICQAGTMHGGAGGEIGILRNRLHVGQFVWNQRRWIKDPAAG